MHILTKSTRKYEDNFINHTDFEEPEQPQLMAETGTATRNRSVTANGKCFNHIYFYH